MNHDSTYLLEDMEAPTTVPAAEADGVEYSLSPGIVARLARLGVSIAFTSYQSGILYFFGHDRGGAHLHQAGVPKPMGICVEAGGLTLVSGAQIIRFSNVLESHQRINDRFDGCYVPRAIHVTGDLDAHDVGIDADNRPIFVNTRFNCLATISSRHSFEMVWKPPFISGLLDGDKCHLNGLAMADGEAAFVTAASRSDVIDGWRDRRADGGVVIDVRSGDIVCAGLSMPHSPRLHNGELWVLNSGTGELGTVTRSRTGKGRFEPRAFCPGFVRGLSFFGKYAFVGLSKPRYRRFVGLALDARLKERDAEPWCGVQIIDLETGNCVDWLRIDGAIGELYDVAVIPRVACAMALTPGSPEAASLVTVSAAAPRAAAPGRASGLHSSLESAGAVAAECP
jgi:uncharacterized protein (TIGR03032 family)